MWFSKKVIKENKNMKWAAVAAFLVMVAVNMMAVLLPLNGVTSAEVSDKYSNLFAPAGVTFSIWSVIYTLLLVYVVTQFAKMRKKLGLDVREDLYRKITPWFIASSLLNAVWLVFWHLEWLWLTVPIMIGLLYTLIKIAEATTAEKWVSWKEYVAVRLPFTVYFGWITVATIANISSWLVSTGFTGGPIKPGAWMVGVVFTGLAVAIAVAAKHRDPAYIAVFLWAYGGILLKHLSDNGFKGMYPSVIIAVTICFTVLLGVFVLMTKGKQLLGEKDG